MAADLAPMFRYPIAISATDIDAMGHVNNAVYLQWVQEAMVAYWQRNASAETQSELLWVALRHEVNYRVPLFLGDNVEADVTATGAKGSRAFFTTQFRRGKELAAEVCSTWGCVDAANRRPRRISDDVSNAFLSS
nr:thioesterase family protein [Paracoccus saliphilus]